MEFRILGPLEVLAGDEAVVLAAGKQRALLADLLLNANRAVPTAQLIDDLWGDRPPDTAVKALQVYVSKVRKVLPDARVHTRGPGYLLEVADGELDLAEFLRLAGEGRAAIGSGDPVSGRDLLGQALSLWRGPALAEFLEPFAQGEAARLEELRLGCLEDRIESDLALGSSTAVVPELEALVAAHPLREPLRSQLMRALYGAGRQAEALDAYQMFRRRLDDELGIEPSPALRDLERLILQQDASLDPIAPARARSAALTPAAGTGASTGGASTIVRRKPPPVGRESELRAVTRLLAESLDGERRVVFVSGEAGAGKTTLVEAVLEGCANSRSLLVGRGQCIENRGEGEPYLPVLDALGRLGRSDDRVVAQLRRFAPTWLAQLPSLIGEEERDWVARRATGVTPERMLREMCEMLDALASDLPLALVLEDLHWSDQSTLALVDAIARRPDASPLFVIGTYRTEEGAGVRSVVRGLRVRNLCSEVAVGPLSADAVAEYLELRLPGHELPHDVPERITRRTRGVPLFVEKLVDSWVERGAVESEAGRWRLAVPLDDLHSYVPPTLRDLILEQCRPLDQATRELLAAASVVGTEFTGALAAAGAQHREDDADVALSALAERTLIESHDVERWPDGTVTTRYAFTHDLCQETLYEGVSEAQRARMHGRIGLRLEEAYGDAAAQAAVELAWHFTEAGDAARAVRHLLAAAERAFGRTAAPEARAHLDAALALLSEIADDDVRTRLELSVLLLESSTRILMEGWASPHVEASLVRSVAIARELGDVNEEAQALVALGAVHEIGGRYSASERTIAQALALPQEQLSRELRVGSNELMACSLMHQGRHTGAVEAADLALGLAGGELIPEPVAVFGESPRVSSHVWAALALWHLGQPKKAMARAEQAVATAAIAPRAYARSMASVNAAIVSQSLGQPVLTRQWAEAGIDASQRSGYPYWQSVASILRGWARAVDGEPADGLAELLEGLEGARSTGARLDDPYFLALVADVHLRAGDVDAGLAAVDEALEEMRGERGFFCEPELHRLRGELLLARGDDEAGRASLERAAEIARAQGALSYELRATVSLARTKGDRGSAEQVARLLASFTEGADLPELVGARALCVELGVAVPAVAEHQTHESAPQVSAGAPVPVQYARSGDLSIAYQVTGGGPPDLVLVPGFVSHLDRDWEEPRHAHFLDRLGSFARLIRFDKRGTGLSDRPEGLPDLETRMDDVRAVMDAAGSKRAVVFGYSEGAPLAVLFAATYPERVESLVLFGSYAKRLDPDDDYPWAATRESRRAYIDQVSSDWGWENDMRTMCPSADDAMARWWGERGRAAASPGAVRALMEMNSLIDVRDALGAVHVPTLVLHRTGDLDVDVAEGRYVARHIEGARFIELAGRDHFVAIGPDQILDAVEPFVRTAEAVRGRRPPALGGDRVLATMLFTDVVGSTETAIRLGDAAWAALLDRHHAIVRDELLRYAGEEIDTAGDGFLAVFDGPARAIRCGQAISDRMRELDLDIRAGVHTGEVERASGVVRGIAVHVAARVADSAAPREVLVSATTRDLVAGSGLEFVDRGEHLLKGLDGARRLYAVSS